MKSFLFTVVQFIFSIVMYLLGTVFLGLALAPGIYLFMRVWEISSGFNMISRCVVLGLAMGGSYFIFGISLILIAGLTRWVLRLRLNEGSYPIFSFETSKWAFLGTLYCFINFTFVNFILLTPFANLLLRLLGAKIGKNVQINSRFVFDASLLEIGDNSVIGGGAVIIGHQVQRSVLKLQKVIIGKNVTIGSNALIPPGCEIGDKTIIAAGTIMMKNTKAPARSIWQGVPAVNVREQKNRRKNAEAS